MHNSHYMLILCHVGKVFIVRCLSLSWCRYCTLWWFYLWPLTFHPVSTHKVCFTTFCTTYCTCVVRPGNLYLWKFKLTCNLPTQQCQLCLCTWTPSWKEFYYVEWYGTVYTNQRNWVHCLLRLPSRSKLCVNHFSWEREVDEATGGMKLFQTTLSLWAIKAKEGFPYQEIWPRKGHLTLHTTKAKHIEFWHINTYKFLKLVWVTLTGL